MATKGLLTLRIDWKEAKRCHCWTGLLMKSISVLCSKTNIFYSVAQCKFFFFETGSQHAALASLEFTMCPGWPWTVDLLYGLRKISDNIQPHSACLLVINNDYKSLESRIFWRLKAGCRCKSPHFYQEPQTRGYLIFVPFLLEKYTPVSLAGTFLGLQFPSIKEWDRERYGRWGTLCPDKSFSHSGQHSEGPISHDTGWRLSTERLCRKGPWTGR
jgi:hypothetical protein